MGKKDANRRLFVFDHAREPYSAALKKECSLILLGVSSAYNGGKVVILLPKTAQYSKTLLTVPDW